MSQEYHDHLHVHILNVELLLITIAETKSCDNILLIKF